MAIPHELSSKKSVVFSYSADLDVAAGTLAGRLNGSRVRVRLNKGGIKDVLDNIPHDGEVAWLVGHGLKSDSYLGSLSRGVYVEVSELLEWLEKNKYSAVVDTGCQPDQRRLVGAKYKMDYYATNDGQDVFQITQYKTADKWWDANGITKK